MPSVNPILGLSAGPALTRPEFPDINGLGRDKSGDAIRPSPSSRVPAVMVSGSGSGSGAALKSRGNGAGGVGPGNNVVDDGPIADELHRKDALGKGIVQKDGLRVPSFRRDSMGRNRSTPEQTMYGAYPVAQPTPENVEMFLGVPSTITPQHFAGASRAAQRSGVEFQRIQRQYPPPGSGTSQLDSSRRVEQGGYPDSSSVNDNNAADGIMAPFNNKRSPFDMANLRNPRVLDRPREGEQPNRNERSSTEKFPVVSHGGRMGGINYYPEINQSREVKTRNSMDQSRDRSRSGGDRFNSLEANRRRGNADPMGRHKSSDVVSSPSDGVVSSVQEQRRQVMQMQRPSRRLPDGSGFLMWDEVVARPLWYLEDEVFPGETFPSGHKGKRAWGKDGYGFERPDDGFAGAAGGPSEESPKGRRDFGVDVDPWSGGDDLAYGQVDPRLPYPRGDKNTIPSWFLRHGLITSSWYPKSNPYPDAYRPPRGRVSPAKIAGDEIRDELVGPHRHAGPHQHGPQGSGLGDGDGAGLASRSSRSPPPPWEAAGQQPGGAYPLYSTENRDLETPTAPEASLRGEDPSLFPAGVTRGTGSIGASGPLLPLAMSVVTPPEEGEKSNIIGNGKSSSEKSHDLEMQLRNVDMLRKHTDQIVTDILRFQEEIDVRAAASGVSGAGKMSAKALPAPKDLTQRIREHPLVQRALRYRAIAPDMQLDDKSLLQIHNAWIGLQVEMVEEAYRRELWARRQSEGAYYVEAVARRKALQEIEVARQREAQAEYRAEQARRERAQAEADADREHREVSRLAALLAEKDALLEEKEQRRIDAEVAREKAREEAAVMYENVVKTRLVQETSDLRTKVSNLEGESRAAKESAEVTRALQELRTQNEKLSDQLAVQMKAHAEEQHRAQLPDDEDYLKKGPGDRGPEDKGGDHDVSSSSRGPFRGSPLSKRGREDDWELAHARRQAATYLIHMTGAEVGQGNYTLI